MTRLRCIKTLKGEYRKGKFYRGVTEDIKQKGDAYKIVADDGKEKYALKSHFKIEE